MNKKEYIPVAVLAAVAVIAPAVPWPVLRLLDWTVVRIGIVIGLIAAVYHGYATGLVALIAVAALYMERNRHKVNSARKRFDELKDRDNQEVPATVEEEGQPQETVPVQDFDVPDGKIATYEPKRTTGTDSFERVLFSENLNDKAPLPTVPIGAKSANIFTPYVESNPRRMSV